MYLRTASRYLLSHDNDSVKVGVKFVLLVMIKMIAIYVVVTCVVSIQ